MALCHHIIKFEGRVVMLIRWILANSCRWTDVQRLEAKKQGFGYRVALFARLVCSSSVPYVLSLGTENIKLFNKLPYRWKTASVKISKCDNTIGTIEDDGVGELALPALFSIMGVFNSRVCILLYIHSRKLLEHVGCVICPVSALCLEQFLLDE